MQKNWFCTYQRLYHIQLQYPKWNMHKFNTERNPRKCNCVKFVQRKSYWVRSCGGDFIIIELDWILRHFYLPHCSLFQLYIKMKTTINFNCFKIHNRIIMICPKSTKHKSKMLLSWTSKSLHIQQILHQLMAWIKQVDVPLTQRGTYTHD